MLALTAIDELKNEKGGLDMEKAGDIKDTVEGAINEVVDQFGNVKEKVLEGKITQQTSKLIDVIMKRSAKKQEEKSAALHAIREAEEPEKERTHVENPKMKGGNGQSKGDGDKRWEMFSVKGKDAYDTETKQLFETLCLYLSGFLPQCEHF